MKNNLHTVSPHLPFADTLAGWMLERWGGDPLALSRAMVFLPNRRSALALREAFLRVRKGSPLLLPHIMPLGDVEEGTLLSVPETPLPQFLPSEQFSLRRDFILTKLVQAYRSRLTGKEARTDHSLMLAHELGVLLDECEREEASLDTIRELVKGDLAKHWQVTAEFLSLLSENWPAIAREKELLSSARYSALLLDTLAEQWRKDPPQVPVIAAGTTASVPSTMRLLTAVSKLPQGHVILPGLDIWSGEDYHAALEESHPQWGMNHLLAQLKQSRSDVGSIGEPASPRTHFMSEVMRPAALSEHWGNVTLNRQDALAGLRYMDCAHLQEEAGVIALLMREVLEEPGRTAALVTHNRNLARRVASGMRRFGVVVDDSAGIPLDQTPLVAFLRLVLEVVTESFAPLPLLSLFKHPLTHLGMERIACLDAARMLEIHALRGVRLGSGMEGLRRRLQKSRSIPAEILLLLDRLETAIAPLIEIAKRQDATLSEFLHAHIAAAQAIAGPGIWEGREGETVNRLLGDVHQALIQEEMDMYFESYPGCFHQFFLGQVFRPEYGLHPRLKILSPLEARMQSFDRIILGGLNEGSWPAKPESSSWFNRAMQRDLKLPPPERRLGLMAHDFYMLASAPEVILTRSAKEGGTPMQPSRWLVTLQMLAGNALHRDTSFIRWVSALDEPRAVVPVAPPAPCPPLPARPKEISVTQVEQWRRDPYAFYASRILKIESLDDIGQEPGAREFGIILHRILEDFVKLAPGPLPQDAGQQLASLAQAAFAELFADTGLAAVWWPRFESIAQWFLETERQRRPSLAQVGSEVPLAFQWDGFLLKGKIDRLEKTREGGIAIVDYKTGSISTEQDMKNGLSSQLVLLAMLHHALHPQSGPIEVEYWKLSGGRQGGEIKHFNAQKVTAFRETALMGLAGLIARYADPGFAYYSAPIPSWAVRNTSYDHLARRKEWGG